MMEVPLKAILHTLSLQSLRAHVIAVLYLLTISFALFADLFFNPLWAPGGHDLVHYFIPVYKFGFSELARGNFAQWNPYLFCGTPCFATLQSSLLYPLAAPFLFLPLGLAFTVVEFLHFFLLGSFMYCWVVSRKHSPLAGMVAATLVMFSGAMAPRVLAGHVPMIFALAWSPPFFLCIDKIWEKPQLRWLLLGSLALAMQLLASYPQIAYNSLLAAVIYSVFLFKRSDHRGLASFFVVSMVGLGCLLSAVQILPSYLLSAESLRHGGVSPEFAGLYSLPIENLLTLIAYPLFGGTEGISYLGRWDFWSGQVFVGVVGLILMILGIVRGPKQQKRYASWMILILMVFALGSNTLLFRPLLNLIPGLGFFRAHHRFVFQAMLFGALLAAAGFDSLWNLTQKDLRFFWGGLSLAISLIGLAFILLRSSQSLSGWYAKLILLANPQTDQQTVRHVLGDAAMFSALGKHVFNQLIFEALWVAVLGVIFLIIHRHKSLMLLVVILLSVELFLYARRIRGESPVEDQFAIQVKRRLAKVPKDVRMLSPRKRPNLGMAIGQEDIWGYDPFVLARQAQFMAALAKMDISKVYTSFPISGWHSRFDMLRGRFKVTKAGDEPLIKDMGEPLPRLWLVHKYSVVPKTKERLQRLMEKSFDPRVEVLLENEPRPRPKPREKLRERYSKSWAKVEFSSSDEIFISASIKEPAILVMSDAYAAGWGVYNNNKSSQKRYQIMPANHILRAIPLGKGIHRLRLTYDPDGFVAGVLLSVTSLILWLLGWGAIFWKRRAGRFRKIFSFFAAYK